MNGMIKELFDVLIAYIKSFLATFAIDTGLLDACIKLSLVKQHTADYLKQVIKKRSSKEDIAGKVVTLTAFILLLLLHLGTEPVTPTVKALSFLGAIDLLDPNARGFACLFCLILMFIIVVCRAWKLQIELAPYLESNKRIA